MEKRIKTLYIVTIIAIIVFLGMQVYWLYGRYEFSLREYEHHTEAVIADVIVEYNKERDKKGTGDINTSYSMSHGVDSAGNTSRKVTVSSTFNGRKLLGIDEERNLTDEELERLAEIVSDSIQRVEEKNYLSTHRRHPPMVPHGRQCEILNWKSSLRLPFKDSTLY